MKVNGLQAEMQAMKLEATNASARQQDNRSVQILAPCLVTPLKVSTSFSHNPVS